MVLHNGPIKRSEKVCPNHPNRYCTCTAERSGNLDQPERALDLDQTRCAAAAPQTQTQASSQVRSGVRIPTCPLPMTTAATASHMLHVVQPSACRPSDSKSKKGLPFSTQTGPDRQARAPHRCCPPSSPRWRCPGRRPYPPCLLRPCPHAVRSRRARSRSRDAPAPRPPSLCGWSARPPSSSRPRRRRRTTRTSTWRPCLRGKLSHVQLFFSRSCKIASCKRRNC